MLSCDFCSRNSKLLHTVGDKRVYFVHSYRAVPTDKNQDWVLATCGALACHPVVCGYLRRKEDFTLILRNLGLQTMAVSSLRPSRKEISMPPNFTLRSRALWASTF